MYFAYIKHLSEMANHQTCPVSLSEIYRRNKVSDRHSFFIADKIEMDTINTHFISPDQQKDCNNPNPRIQ